MEMDEKNKAIMAKIEALADMKGEAYTVEPVTEVPMDVLLGIIAMKADRALRRKSDEDKIDELYDMVVYGVKALARLESDDIISPKKRR
jgi:hypothetical protein